MKDRIFPDDYTFGWGSTPAPQPLTIAREELIRFEARRWCIDQVVTTRASTPSARPIHEDAAALYAFLFEIPA